MATFQLMDFFEIEGRGFVLVGKVINGTIVKGMETNINGIKARVDSIEIFNKYLEVAKKDENCGLVFKEIIKKDIKKAQIQKGDIIYLE